MAVAGTRQQRESMKAQDRTCSANLELPDPVAGFDDVAVIGPRRASRGSFSQRRVDDALIEAHIVDLQPGGFAPLATGPDFNLGYIIAGPAA